MSDEQMPDEIVTWMNQKGWGEHHAQWHFERKWDFWHAQAEKPNHSKDIDDAIANANLKHWSRASVQEGESENGKDFLFMHRAMLQLLLASFPQHQHYVRGWVTPPQNPVDPADPVPPDRAHPANPVKGVFDPNMANAITRIEAANSAFVSDDAFGLFVQTKWRPVPGNPLNPSADLDAGLHNYLHNRFSDAISTIDMGKPTVNILNQRFWRLHGWIDYQWWRFRKNKNLNDADADYVAKLASCVDMMNEGGHHHEHFAAVLHATSSHGRLNHFMFE